VGQTKLTAILNCTGKECFLQTSWITKFSDHLKVRYSDRFNICCSKKLDFRAGVALEFNF